MEVHVSSFYFPLFPFPFTFVSLSPLYLVLLLPFQTESCCDFCCIWLPREVPFIHVQRRRRGDEIKGRGGVGDSATNLVQPNSPLRHVEEPVERFSSKAQASKDSPCFHSSSWGGREDVRKESRTRLLLSRAKKRERKERVQERGVGKRCIAKWGLKYNYIKRMCVAPQRRRRRGKSFPMCFHYPLQNIPPQSPSLSLHLHVFLFFFPKTRGGD